MPLNLLGNAKRPAWLNGLLIAATLTVAACGSGSRSESELYGRSLSELQSAPATFEHNQQRLRVFAYGNEWKLTTPGFTEWRLDPVTLVSRPVEGRPTTLHYWMVAAAARDEHDQAIALDWAPRTVWVINGSSFISTRDVQRSDPLLGVGAFDDPSIERNDSRAVIELVRGGQTLLLSAPIQWTR